MKRFLKDWTSEEINAHVNEMNVLQKLFKEEGYSLVLGMGTLLGAIRENKVIDHDDDFDVFFIAHSHTFKEALTEFNDILSPRLIEQGYEVKEICWQHQNQKKMLGQYHLIKNNIVIDLWLCWIDKENKIHLTMFIDGKGDIKDLFPLKSFTFYNTQFNIPNNEDKFLQHIYGENWRIPQPNWKADPDWCNVNFLQKRILKVIDQFGWAYHFIAMEQQKYSVHQIDYVRLMDLPRLDLNRYDIIYFSSPGMGHKQINNQIIRTKQEYNKELKIIGGYAGETDLTYNYPDLVVSISSRHLLKLSIMYPGKPIIFLPECVDTNFFTPTSKTEESFIVGYAGRTSIVKRTHLLEKLDFSIKMKTDHGDQFFTEDRTLEPMKEFYSSIDCLVLVSSSECTPKVILEAMACGLPVVSTAVGSIPLLLSDDWMVPALPENLCVQEMNKKLQLLKNNPELRAAVGKHNREWVLKYFSWETRQSVWDNVFNAVYKGDYNEAKRWANDYYKNFPEGWIPRINDIELPPGHKVSLPGYEDTIMWFVGLLEHYGYQYCFVKQTCAEIVCQDAIITSPIQISIPQFDDKLKDNLRKHSCSFENDVIQTACAKFKVTKEKLTLKRFTFRDKIYNVPYPVINYLQNLNLWKHK